MTRVEAAAIARVVTALDVASRRALAARARDGEACAALGDDGRCAVYEARPIVCRSHGLPIRYEEAEAGAPARDGAPAKGPGGKRALPVLDVCPKNFVGVDLATIDSATVLDQRTLSVLLGVIDALFCDESAQARGARVPLRDVLRRTT